MKKIIAVLMLSAVLFSLCACSDTPQDAVLGSGTASVDDQFWNVSDTSSQGLKVADTFSLEGDWVIISSTTNRSNTDSSSADDISDTVTSND